MLSATCSFKLYRQVDFVGELCLFDRCREGGEAVHCAFLPVVQWTLLAVHIFVTGVGVGERCK